MSETIGGLLDDAWKGWSGFWEPKTVPAGASYDAQTLANARMASLGNLGGTLLALAQGGLSPDTRARLLTGIGNAPLTYQQSLLAGGEDRLRAAQIRKLDQEGESQRQFGSMVDDIIRSRQGGGGGQGGGQTAGAPPGQGSVTPGNASPGRIALAALMPQESGGNPGAVNPLGYSGLYQMGTGLAFSAGLYQPAKDEAVTDDKGRAVNAWRGQWTIPGFEPMSHQEFLRNPAAQQKAGEVAMESNWRAIERAGLDKYVGQTVSGVTITPQALLQGAWMGGLGGLRTWLTGQGDPADANRTTVSRTAALVPPGSTTGANPPGGAAPGSGAAPAAPGGGRQNRGDLSQLSNQQLRLLATMTPAERAQWLLTQSNKTVPTALTAQEKTAWGLDPKSVYVWDENGKPSKLQDAPADELSLAEKIRLGYASDAVVQRKSDGTYFVAKEGQRVRLTPEELAANRYAPDMVVERSADGGHHVLQQSQLQQRQQNLFGNARETRSQIESGPVYVNYSQAKPQLMLIRQAEPIGNGASDMAMIYAYAKILDPNSVVRGPEGDMVQRTGGVWDTVQGMIQMVKGDGKLSPAVRRQLVEQAESVFHAHEAGMISRVETYRDLAKRSGLDPDTVYPAITPMSSYAEKRIKPLPGGQTPESFTEGLRKQIKANPASKAAAQAVMNEYGLDPKELDKE